MDSFPEARVIRDMHQKDIDEIRRKLTYFLCGWLGGPRLYAEHYGGISIPGFHQPLPIGESERDAWLLCMEHAIAKQPYDDAFRSEEHTSELQSLMRISYAVFCLKNKSNEMHDDYMIDSSSDDT